MSRLDPPTSRFTRLAAPIARRVYGRDMPEAAAHGHHPRLLCAFMLFNRAVERDDVVPRRLKDLASLRVASMVGCAWCMDFGSHAARGHGVTDEQLLHLHEAHGSGLFDADELLVIDFATVMSVTPPQVDDELAAALRGRFGDKGLVELAAMVAWENHRARLNHALGLEADGFSEGATCVRPQVAEGAGVWR